MLLRKITATTKNHTWRQTGVCAHASLEQSKMRPTALRDNCLLRVALRQLELLTFHTSGIKSSRIFSLVCSPTPSFRHTTERIANVWDLAKN